MTSRASVEPVEKEVKATEKVTLAVVDTRPSGALPKVCPVPAPPARAKKVPIVEKGECKVVHVPVPLKVCSYTLPEVFFDLKPLVLSTHLVPSIPIQLFELIAEIIEHYTQNPVILVHEARTHRPIASNIVDIAFLPASGQWKDGNLLPIGLVFDHRLNVRNTPGVYAEIVVARDIAEQIEDIMDLRGYKVALPSRYTKIGAVGLLFNELKSKGENPSFFGNTLDCETQVAALQMVAGKQTEVGVLEAPVINCHRENLPGVQALLILDSLGPLPPYQIMLNAKLPPGTSEQIKKGLLAASANAQWLQRFKSFGTSGFAEYSKDDYDIEDIKTIDTSVRYY